MILKFNKILLVIVILLILALGFVLYWQLGGFKQPYFAVYLDTGDLYFGQLHWFPTLSLTDVWFIQRNTQNTTNPFTLAKFQQTFWGPQDKIELNEKNIVWKTQLRDDSSIVQTIKNPTAVQNQLPQSTSTLPK